MFKEDRWVVDFINQYAQLFSPHNWYSMTLIQCEFENDSWTGGYEFVFILLGLGIRIRYNTNKAFKLFEQRGEEL